MDVTSFFPSYNKNFSVIEICTNEFLFCNRMNVFDKKAIRFLDKVSQSILKTRSIRQYPELISLAYWLRKGNIISIASDFQKSIDAQKQVVVPRGLAFHIAPSNVDSIFMYSFSLSLLAGNINIVRVTQNISKQLRLLFDVLRSVIQNDRNVEIARTNIFLTYQHDKSISAVFSSLADVRIIWGGNETISTIRSLPSKPTTKDIAFADKFSYCVIKSSAYLQLSGEGHKELGRLFFNDAYWFDQMACSSPRIVYFIGSTNNCEKASDKFWCTLTKELEERRITDTMSIAIKKLAFVYESVINKVNLKKPPIIKFDFPTVARLSENQRDSISSIPCGGGFFYECFLKEIDDLSQTVKQNDQTITYFGFEKKKLLEFIHALRGKGVDRVVPIGEAMNFSPVWDGYLLMNELTKRVTII